jgi:hypothetical protein
MFTRVAAFIQDPVNLPIRSQNPPHDPSPLLRDQSPRVNFYDLVVPMVVLLNLVAIGRMALLRDLYRHLKLFLRQPPSQPQPNVSYLNRLQLLRLRIIVHHPRRLSVLLRHHLQLLLQRLRRLLRNLLPKSCMISPVTDPMSLQFTREKSFRLSPRKEMVCSKFFFFFTLLFSNVYLL